MFAKTLLTAITFAGFSAAQTYTDCNPTEEECSPAPALGNTQIDCDLTNGLCDGFSQLDGTNITFSEKGALFRLETEDQAPTIATDKYIFFGRVEVECQAAAGQGIVTAIVLLSADLDEIDWEWVGGKDSQVQSNCFGKAGVNATFDCVDEHSIADPFTTSHTYGFEWTSSKLDWLIDGEVVRTLAYEDAEGGSRFPQTPSQVKIGTWVGGKSSNSDGLIWWAGGLADFDDAPFDAYYKSVKVIDYAGGDSAATESILEYAYGDMSGTWESIEVVKGEAVSSSSSSSTLPATTASEKSATSSSSVPSTSVTPETTNGAVESSQVDSTLPTTPASQTMSPSSVVGSHTASSPTPAETSTTYDNSATSAFESETNSLPSSATSLAPTPTATASLSSVEQFTTSTVFSTSVYTVTSCAPTVTNCPADSTVVVTETVPVLTTVCPISASETNVESSNSAVPTGSSNEKFTTSTIFATSIRTVTSCAPTVTNCPAESTVLVTETVPVSTTICPISSSAVESQSDDSPAPTGNTQGQLTTSTIFATSIRTVTSCAPTVTNCPAESTGLVTETVPVSTTVYPISASSTESQSDNSPVSTTVYPISASSTESQSSNAPVSTGNAQDQPTASTIFTTSIQTFTSCAPTVENCPADSTVLVTYTKPISTTIYLSLVSSTPAQTATEASNVKVSQSAKPAAGSPLATPSGLTTNISPLPSTPGSVTSPSPVATPTSSHLSPSLNGTAASQLPLTAAGATSSARGVIFASFLALGIVLVA